MLKSVCQGNTLKFKKKKTGSVLHHCKGNGMGDPTLEQIEGGQNPPRPLIVLGTRL